MTNFFLTLVAFFSFVEICAAQSDEIISTKAAREKYEQFLKGKSFLAFPELREKPLKWFDSIPEGRVIQALHSEDFVLNAHPGEFFVYQLGVWAQEKDVSQVQVQFSGLTKGNSSTIPVGKMTYFNAGGIDFKGLPFTKEITVPAGRMQALWIGIDLSGIDAGNYKGSVAVKGSRRSGCGSRLQRR